jgi:hypothetical protein
MFFEYLFVWVPLCHVQKMTLSADKINDDKMRNYSINALKFLSFFYLLADRQMG